MIYIIVYVYNQVYYLFYIKHVLLSPPEQLRVDFTPLKEHQVDTTVVLNVEKRREIKETNSLILSARALSSFTFQIPSGAWSPALDSAFPSESSNRSHTNIWCHSACTSPRGLQVMS